METAQLCCRLPLSIKRKAPGAVGQMALQLRDFDLGRPENRQRRSDVERSRLRFRARCAKAQPTQHRFALARPTRACHRSRSVAANVCVAQRDDRKFRIRKSHLQNGRIVVIGNARRADFRNAACRSRFRRVPKCAAGRKSGSATPKRLFAGAPLPSVFRR